MEPELRGQSAVHPFRFDVETHQYVDLVSGEELPHITGMLWQTNWIDDRWYTEESCDRGQAVHKLTADFDLGALDPDMCVSPFRNYLLAHVKAMTTLRPEILSVEEPIAHGHYRFAGRPDRVERIYGLLSVLEIKSGDPEKSHQIQTALQAILTSSRTNLPAEMWGRFALYVKKNGKFKVEQHRDRKDFDEAYRIIRAVCAR